MSATGNLRVSTLSSNRMTSITETTVGILDRSFGLVVQWENVRLPSRLIIGSADLRKVTIRIRQQPINILETVHDSLTTSQEGQNLCVRGTEIASTLLSEEHDHLVEEFAKTSLEEIRDAARRLDEYTNSMHMQFRDLRVEVFNVHSELSTVIKKRGDAFLARLSRCLSKDVKTCEADLEQIGQGIQEIEETLNILTRLWHQIANHANYLLKISRSSLAVAQNPLILTEIRDNFRALGSYLEEYSAKAGFPPTLAPNPAHQKQQVYQVYDENIAKLNKDSRKQLMDACWRGVVKLHPPSPQAPQPLTK